MFEYSQNILPEIKNFAIRGQDFYNRHTMKKWFIYISALTVVTLLAGVLFVYGAFDFSFNRAHLIGGTTRESVEKNLHDRVVIYLHDIGNQFQELSTFDITSNLDEANRKNNTLKENQARLNEFFNTNTFTKRQQPIKISYFNTK
jgi:hypothetical protein